MSQVRSIRKLTTFFCRTGELPDIQISFADVLKPLRNVCQRDSVLCRTLLVNLCSSLAAEDGQADFRTELGGCLGSVLVRANMTNRTLASALIEVMIKMGSGETWSQGSPQSLTSTCR